MVNNLMVNKGLYNRILFEVNGKRRDNLETMCLLGERNNFICKEESIIGKAGRHNYDIDQTSYLPATKRLNYEGLNLIGYFHNHIDFVTLEQLPENFKRFEKDIRYLTHLDSNFKDKKNELLLIPSKQDLQMLNSIRVNLEDKKVNIAKELYVFMVNPEGKIKAYDSNGNEKKVTIL